MIGPAPVAPSAPSVSPFSPTICQGMSVVLSTTGCAEEVVWSSGHSDVNLTLSPLKSITLTVWCRNGGDCLSSPTTVTIFVKPFPGNAQIQASANPACAGSVVTLDAGGCMAGSTVIWNDGFSGTQRTITASYGQFVWARCMKDGCISDAIAPLALSVISPPMPVLVASSATVCAGSSTQLRADGCEGEVFWSTGEQGSVITVWPLATQTVTAFCRMNNCSSPAASLEIWVPPVPLPPVLHNLTVCEGTTAVLTPFGCGGTVTTLQTETSITTGYFSNTVVSYTMVCTEGSCVSLPGVGSITYLALPGEPQLSMTQPQPICPGSAVTLQVTNCGGGSVSWSTGLYGDSVIVYPSGPMTMSVTCFNGACPSPTKPIVFQQP